MTLAAPRQVCARCRRPESVCYCAFLPSLPARTRVLLLQHPRERRVGIGTASMAHLSLPGSLLRVGVDFTNDPVVNETLAEARPAYLLFPGSESVDVKTLQPAGPITLVVVDGTWSQARSLVRRNAALAALPRIAFTPRRPSEYRIRKEPADFCVSTIEALAEVLNVLEPEAGPFDSLLDPFRAMVDRQERFAREVASNRHHGRDRSTRQRRPPLGARLAALLSRVVCVQGEANGWPVHHPDRQEPEIVHYVACRPASGELYEAVVAPRRPLAPHTASHIELPESRITSGMTVEEWRRSWDAFLRPDDVLVQWGRFYTRLAMVDEVNPPPARLDLRGELAHLRQRGGTLEECVERLGAKVTPLGLDGRGGRRLDALVAITRALVAQPEFAERADRPL